MDINGFEEHVIKKIIVYDEINRNSKCEVELTIENENLQNFLLNTKIGENSIVVSKEGDIIFSGSIQQLDYERTYLKTDVHIVAFSFSKEMDSEIHNRIFQNPNKTYNKLCDFFSSKQITIKCIDESFGSEQINDVLIQHNETDFEFLCRVFKEKHQDIYIINNKRNRCSIEIGENKKTNSVSISEEDIHTIKHRKYKKYEIIELSTKLLFEIGSLIEVYGNTYKVVARKFVTEYEVEEIYYSLIKIFENNEVVEDLNSFSLGLAKVINNFSEDHMGKIQVEFLNYEDVMADERIWIDYMSPLTDKGGGIIILPDKDETVEVIYRNNVCIAIGCIRNVIIDKSYQDINKRYYVSRNCVFTNSDNSIEFLIDKNNIKITDKDIILSNGEFNVFINGEQCKIGYKNAKVLLNKDVLQILVNNTIDIKSEEINIAGENTVKVKTKSFDVG